MSRRPLIAFNLAFIDAGPLTGPGYYAVQLFEHALQHDKGLRIIGYAPMSARHHFSEMARLSLRILPNFAGRVSRVIYEQVMLPLRANRDCVDLLFSPAFVSPLWGAAARVVTICDMYYAIVPEATERWQRLYWKTFIPLSAKRCRHIVTISKNSQSDIESIISCAKGKVTSIPLASRMHFSPTESSLLDPDNSSNDEEYPSLLLVANLTPNKNPQIVASALSILNGRNVKVKLTHIGKDHLGLLAKAVRDHGVDAQLISLGKVSDSELRQAYRRATAVVVPSLYEGFGMPAVESQAMGAPLICSNRGALPEAAGNGALFFDPTDAVSLADRVCELLKMTSAQRNDLIAKGFANAATMSWQRTADETVALLQRILSEIQ